MFLSLLFCKKRYNNIELTKGSWCVYLKILLIMIVINLFGFVKYIDYSVQGVSYKKQMLTDFLCPIGSFIGRLLFKFKIKENSSGYISGFFLQVFLLILFLTIF